MDRIETAEKIAELTEGKIWKTTTETGEIGKLRVYLPNRRWGYVVICADCRADIDAVKRDAWQVTRDALNAAGIETFRGTGR